MEFSTEQIHYIMKSCNCDQGAAAEALDFAFSEPWVPIMLMTGAGCRRKTLVDKAAARYRQSELEGLPLAELKRRAGEA